MHEKVNINLSKDVIPVEANEDEAVDSDGTDNAQLHDFFISPVPHTKRHGYTNLHFERSAQQIA